MKANSRASMVWDDLRTLSALDPLIWLLGLLCLLTVNGLVSELLIVGSGRAQAFGVVKDLALIGLAVVVSTTRRSLLLMAPRLLVIPVVALTGIAVIAAAGTPNVSQALYGLRNDYEPLLLLLIVPPILAGSLRRTQVVGEVIVALGELASVTALMTRAIGIKWLYVLHILPPRGSWPESYFPTGTMQPRAFSPYPAPNELAIAVVFALCVIGARGDWRLRTRVLLACPLLIALLLSQSRSGLVALGIAVALIAYRTARGFRKHQRIILLGTAIGLTSILGGAIVLRALTHATGIVDPSVYFHASSLHQAVSDLMQHPWGFGTGTAGPRAARFSNSPHLVESFFGVIALEAGLLAVSIYIAIVAVLFVIIAPGSWSLDRIADQQFLAVSALAASLANQAVLPSMQDASISWQLWIIVSVGIAYSQQTRAVAPITASRTQRLG